MAATGRRRADRLVIQAFGVLPVWALAMVLGMVLGLVATPLRAQTGVSAPAVNPAAGAAIGDTAAELRSVSGVVFTQKPNAEVVIATKGAKLAVGDTVGTEKGAFALVVFNDGSRVALRPESALVIRGFSFKPDDPSQDKLSVELLKGWLRNVSGQIGKRGNQAAFDMQVSDTTIGIRGTDFAVRLCDEGCVGTTSRGDEGVLPQSGRLGQVLSADEAPQRTRDGIAAPAAAGTALFLGDEVAAAGSQALLGLDDGTRLVLGQGGRVALRAEEDERGRRAIRVDVLEGTLRLATPALPGARLYGLLVNAGELLGVRQDSAVDVACEQAAAAGAFACPSATATLRRGRSEVLSDTAVRSLAPGEPARLVEPAVTPPPATAPTSATPPPPAGAPGPSSAPAPSAAPGVAPPAGGTPAAPTPTTRSGHRGSALALRFGAEEWDTWAPGLAPQRRSRVAVGWDGRADPWAPLPGRWDGTMPSWPPLAQAAPAGPGGGLGGGPGGGLGGGLDPLDIPADAARPPGANAPLQQGVYTAVFQGAIAVAKPSGQIVVPAGQGAFAPTTPQPPQNLPAAPAFMERDSQLDSGSLRPEQCPR